MDPTSFALLFEQYAALTPNNTALVINDIAYTYCDVVDRVKPVAQYLQAHGVRRVGILASRSLETYLAILGAHWVGAGYVALNPTFPVFQLDNIVERAHVDAIIIDPLGERVMQSFQPKRNIPIIVPSQLEKKVGDFKPSRVNGSDVAYVIFTSGTTGEPKAIPISFDNLTHLSHYVKKQYPLTASDKVSQHSRISFDFSILEFLFAWTSGATLCVVPEEVLSAPAKFIQDNAITVWCAVPSVVSFMNKLNLLKPNVFPSLKYSFLSGEALTFSQADQWMQTAPNQILENIYGPSETTVFCLTHTYSDASEDHIQNDIVPLGKPLPGMSAAIVNEAHEFLSHGDRGELIISGPQVTMGYLDNEALNQKHMIELTEPKDNKTGSQDNPKKRWYLSGDYCYQDQTGAFHYLGRVDNQCKVLGHRIELEGIEYYLRKIHGNNEVAAAIIKKDSLNPMIVGAVVDPNIDLAAMKTQLKEYLPPYMIPTYLIALDELPKNTNGKLDRKQLIINISQMLDIKP